MNNKWWSSIVISGVILIICHGAVSAAATSSPKEVEKWVQKTLSHQKVEKVTKLHFYFHRTSTSAVLVAQPNDTTLPFAFGGVNARDDPLTLGADLSSTLIGHAQGIGAGSSLEEPAISESFTFVFTHPQMHNGSTLSLCGYNPILRDYREVPVVGGTGAFRLARGFATYKTVFYNATAFLSTVEVNLVVFHF